MNKKLLEFIFLICFLLLGSSLAFGVCAGGYELKASDNTISTLIAHDDQQGSVQTALNGVTTWTLREYRTTGIVYPHIAKSDVFSFVFQFTHKRKLASNLDSFHLHYIPIAAATGEIRLDYNWGWYNINDIIPATLPNTGTVLLTLEASDQYKHKISAILSNLTPPANEGNSSILLVKLSRGTPSGADWGNGEIAILYGDCHTPINRHGSVNEY